MAHPQHPDSPSPGEGPESSPMRLRVAAWDVICTAAVVTVLVVVATTTSWPSRLFGFLSAVCVGDDCPAVPFGVDVYIYPVVWGGIGAAAAALLIGPVVSLVKGWHMFFWPLLAIAIVILSALAGSVLTAFGENYWH